MRKHEVKIGSTYLCKVSGRIVPVTILRAETHGGWTAENTRTGREVRIKTAARLRGPAPVRIPVQVSEPDASGFFNLDNGSVAGSHFADADSAHLNTWATERDI